MWRVRRARFDRAGVVVAMWSADQPPDDQDRNLGSGFSQLPIGGIALDRLVTRLFEVSLAVTACRSLVDPMVSAGLDSVIAMLNELIRDIRLAVFEARAQLDSKHPGVADDRPPPIRFDTQENSFIDSSVSHEGLVPLLREVSITIDGLWRGALDGNHSPAAVTLAEASHSLHRAIIALR
jgi:hypothetical protein